MMLNDGLNNWSAVKIMCERVQLPLKVGYQIFAMAVEANDAKGRPVDMVDVAHAIKYASENKHRLIGY